MSQQPLIKFRKYPNLKIHQISFGKINSAAKLCRESNAVDKISPNPIFNISKQAKIGVGGRGGLQIMENKMIPYWTPLC